MKKKLIKITGIVSLILFSGLTTIGQTESFNKGGFKITQTIKTIDNVKVIVSQNKSLTHIDPMCTANIKIFKNDRQIDFFNISNEQFDGVGDRYGLLIYNELIKSHIIISKFGSYDGQNIIINKKGKKFITLGGFSSLDKKNGILFSIYHSDISGFSVFDLNKDKELFSIKMYDDRAREFYMSGNKYLVKTDQNNTNPGKIWEIDLKKKKLKKTEIQMSSLKDMKLKELVDYTGIKIECQ